MKKFLHFCFGLIVFALFALFIEGAARVLPAISPPWLRQRQMLAKFALERNEVHTFKREKRSLSTGSLL